MISAIAGILNSAAPDVPYTGTLAADYISARGITDTSHIAAVNTLVTDLYAAGLIEPDGSSSKILGLYLYGGTQFSASNHKWNFMNPVDTDAAYRETYFGGLTHSSIGITGNGTDGYIDNHFTHADFASKDDAHVMTYSRQNIAEGANQLKPLFGNIDVNFKGTVLYPSYNGTTMFTSVFSGTGATLANTDSSGLYVSSRTGATTNAIYRNGTLFNQQNATSVAVTTTTSILGLARSYNSGATPALYSKQNICARSYGGGMDSTESVAYSDALNAYFTTLGINSY